MGRETAPSKRSMLLALSVYLSSQYIIIGIRLCISFITQHKDYDNDDYWDYDDDYYRRSTGQRAQVGDPNCSNLMLKYQFVFVHEFKKVVPRILIFS
mmetsp:Transcript_33547/g.33792  ORF Transcript_33547/g.33792 Transcript_33547/m.33792 type:complete len:97 (+) Transcript_33547:192-482(+)